MAHRHVFPHEPPSIIPPRMLARNSNLALFGDDSDVEELPVRPAQSALVPRPPAAGQVWNQKDSSSSIIPIGSHTSGLTFRSDPANLGEDDQLHLPLYYSTNHKNTQRSRRECSQRRWGPSGTYSRVLISDTAKAYAVKSARYPVLYEILKTPPAARKALRRWKREGRQALPDETPTAPRALDGAPDRPLIVEDGQPVADENSSSPKDDGARHAAEGSSHSQEPAPPDNSGPSGTGPDADQVQAGSSSTSAPSTTALEVGRPTPVRALPPQHMTFSEPVLEKTRRGSRLVVTCKLEKSYPNFHLQCEYLYVDEHERVNQSQRDTRMSFAIISTADNIWVVAMEQKGYNEDFVRGLVGDEEYARLERGVSGPVRGHDKRSGHSAVARVAKKIQIAEGFDLGGIWCKAAGFYEMRIYIPRRKQ